MRLHGIRDENQCFDLGTLGPAIQAILADKFPDRVLDRVIGYGSYFWGGYIDRASDIDIAVVLAKVSDLNNPMASEESKPVFFSLPEASVNLHILDVHALEKNRKLTHAMPGKVLARGEILFDNPATRDLRRVIQSHYQQVSYFEAKMRYSDIWLSRSNELMESAERLSAKAETLKLTTIRWDVISDAQAAAVFALWSVLYRRDIDPSPKPLRWNSASLASIGAMFHPQLQNICRIAKVLPVEHMLHADMFRKVTRREVDRALGAARAICLAVNAL